MTLSCDDCALSGVCLPSGLDYAQIEVLESKIHTGVRVEKSKHLYDVGTPFTGLYAVKSGSFKSVLSESNGDEQIVGFHLPGELIGFDGYAAEHTVSTVALEASSVCKIPSENLDFLMSEFKGVSSHVNSMVANDVRAHNVTLLLIAKKSVEDRILCFLKNIGDRYKKRGYSPTHFTLSMPRGDIANFLGMAPETVSRLFSNLADEKLVEIDRRDVHIINPEELSRRSCGHMSLK